MKVVMITGSPHKNGTSARLAEEFCKGAQEAGHEVYRFDAAFRKVHPCIACEHCHNTDKGCVFQDAMEELNPQLLSADAVIFVSPIYYYGMTAQIKTVIDRFYANDEALHGPKKTALLLAFADEEMESAEGAIMSFRGMTGFLEWENMGELAALGCTTPEDIEDTEFLRQAYEMGRNFSAGEEK